MDIFKQLFYDISMQI